MQITNLHPDTPTHVWTKYGYMERGALVASTRREEDLQAVTTYDEYRLLLSKELVRRDCHIALKHGLVIGTNLHS